MPVKEKIGIVVSNKMQKTVVVKVESLRQNPPKEQSRSPLNMDPCAQS